VVLRFGQGPRVGVHQKVNSRAGCDLHEFWIRQAGDRVLVRRPWRREQPPEKYKPVDVRRGTLDEAVFFALGSNKKDRFACLKRHISTMPSG
jgi:hypothetical protein